jgi:chromosome partitioning protein
MARCRAIFNQKGGVGKTTLTCNLAACSAQGGDRTLVLDLDPQGNSTQYLLGADEPLPHSTAVDFFEEHLYRTINPKGLAACIHPTPFDRLDIIPAHPDLEYLAEKLKLRHKTYALKEALDSCLDYGCIYIDTPPSLGFYTRAALTAADACLIPFDCDYLTRRALGALLDFANQVRMEHNPGLELEGIVVNQFVATAILPARIVSELRAAGLPVLNTYLSSSIKIRESRERGLPMAYLDPRHKLAVQFQELHNALHTP